MAEAGTLILCVALYLLLAPLTPVWEARYVKLEKEWLRAIREGLWKEFFFLEPTLLRKILYASGFTSALASVLTGSLLPLILLLSVCVAGPTLFLHILKKRRRNLFARQFASSLTQMASILKAGHTFEKAIEALSRTQPNPLAQELELMLKEIRLGTLQSEALQALLNRFPDRDLEMVVRSVDLSRRIGSNLAEVLERVSETIRARAALRDRLRTLTAQGRMQAWVAIALPGAIGFLLTRISPGYLDPIFSTGAGRLFLIVGSAQLALGGYWIHRISRTELVR